MVKKLLAVLRRFAVFLVMAAGLMSQSSMAELLQDYSRTVTDEHWYQNEFYSTSNEALDACNAYTLQLEGIRTCHPAGSFEGAILYEDGWSSCLTLPGCKFTPRYRFVFLSLLGCAVGYHPVMTPSGRVGCRENRPKPIEPDCRSSQDVDGYALPNPILPYTQEKYRSELDWESHGPSALSIARIYRSNRAFEPDKGSARVGLSWTHNHHWRLKITREDDLEIAEVVTPESYSRVFSRAVGDRKSVV